MSDIRFDSVRFSKTKITNDGYLETDAVVTRTGVFLYKNADGTTRRELRHPDDVFKQDSLATMKMIPIADSHPAQKIVNAKTAKELQIGNVGENVRPDGKHVRAPILITDESGVQKVQKGKNQLSLGYTADVIPETGTYNGIRYDCRQTNIKYNHLAICAVARAGAEASIKLDEGEAMQMDEIITDDEIINNSNKKGVINMLKIRIDDVDYEAAPQVINDHKKLTARIDELEKDLETKKGTLDALDAEKEKLDEQVKNFEKTLNDEVDKAVKERVTLFDSVRDILDEKTKLDEMTNIDIKKAVILAISKDAKLDDVSNDYINGRFEAALENNKSRKDAGDQNKTINDASGKPDNKGVSRLDEARENYLKRLRGEKTEGGK